MRSSLHEPGLEHFAWFTFDDEQQPRAVGMRLVSSVLRGALYEVLEWYGPQDVRRTHWRFQTDDGKGINDSHGHAAGDDFLCKVADAMRAGVRETDICARLGGDEFLIFASGCDLDAATEIARRILGCLPGHRSLPCKALRRGRVRPIGSWRAR